MSKYLSLVCLYNKSAFRKTILLGATIPLTFAAIYAVKFRLMGPGGSFMAMERTLGGAWTVLAFVVILVLSVTGTMNSVNGKKALKAAHSTTGYTIRRLYISPLASYLTMYGYYLLMIVILWGAAIVSVLGIGYFGMSAAGAADTDARLALGILRTDIGHALLPIAHPQVLIFNIVSVLALAGDTARSSYLSWHNSRPSAGILVVSLAMFVVWSFKLSDSYLLIVILVQSMYVVFLAGDVMAREKHPKGDPFLVNKYVGMVDMDSTEFDEDLLMAVNNNSGTIGREGGETALFEDIEHHKRDLFYLRRRYLPMGINMERADFLLGACIFVGLAGKIAFYGRFFMKLRAINNSLTGVTIDSEMMMPYFWDLQKHAYYGYLIAIILVFFLQAYLNYSYYNKETKSVFVMRRLPDRKEYARTIWTSPALESFMIVIIMAAHTVLDMIMYVFFTPHAALHPDYLINLLPF